MTIPYFYIIQQKSTGRYYAGSRWAAGSTPLELLQEDGYKTSSSTIQKILEDDGLESFVIVKTRTFDEPAKAYEYETRFLRKVKAKVNQRFINKHENDRPPAYGTEEHRQYMMDKYGVTHNTQIPEVIERMKSSQKKFYEDNPELLLKRAAKCLENKIARGTTGKGVKKPPRPEGHKIGKYKRSAETLQKLSEVRKGKGTGDSNAMSNPEHRAKVAESKRGRKRYYNEDRTQAKYCIPGTEPEGWQLA